MLHRTRRNVLAALAALPVGLRVGGLAAQARPHLILATAGPGSAFLEFGQAVATVAARYTQIEIELRETKGSNENVALVSAGEVQLACLNMGPGFDAWNGRGPFAGRKLRGMRALVPMYETPFHTVALRSSAIARLADLDGKRVGVGPAGGPGEVFFSGIAETLGIHPVVVAGPLNDLATQLLAKQIDAFWFGSGLPTPPFVDITRQAEATVIGFTAPEAEAFRRQFPYFAPFEIPANTYRGQETALSSVAVWNFVVAHEGVDGDVARTLTAALIGHVDDVKAMMMAAGSMTAANLRADTFMPFHDGALRYYKEIDVVVPAVN